MALEELEERREQAAVSLRVITPTLHYCPIFEKNIGEAQCCQNTTDRQKNAEFCQKITCSSPWRACYACISQGMVSPASRVINRKQGLCQFHTKHGPGERRIDPIYDTVKPYSKKITPLPLKQDGGRGENPPREIGRMIWVKIKREASTIADIAEELAKPIGWVQDHLKLVRPSYARELARQEEKAGRLKPHIVLVREERTVLPSVKRPIKRAAPRKEMGKVAKIEKSALDVAREIKNLKDGGMPVTKIAKKYHHHITWVYTQLKRLKGSGKAGETTRRSRPQPTAVVERHRGNAKAPAGIRERIQEAQGLIRRGQELLAQVRAEVIEYTKLLEAADHSGRAVSGQKRKAKR